MEEPGRGRLLSCSGAAAVAGALGAGAAGGSGEVFPGIPAPAAPFYWGASGAAIGGYIGSNIAISTEAGSETFGLPGAIIGAGIGIVSGILEDIFGGGPELPSGPIRWKETHWGGDPHEWAKKNGIYPAWVASMHPLVGVQGTQGGMPGVQLVGFVIPFGVPGSILLGGGNCGLVGGAAGGTAGAALGGPSIVGNLIFGVAGAAVGNSLGQWVCNNACAGTANCNEEKMLQDYYKRHPSPSPPERPLAGPQ